MSDALVAQLLWIPNLWMKGGYTSALIKQTVAEAADRIEQLTTERDALREGMELAWGVIANVSEGRWDEQTAEWVAAAERWRDEHWHVIPLAPEDGER